MVMAGMLLAAGCQSGDTPGVPSPLTPPAGPPPSSSVPPPPETVTSVPSPAAARPVVMLDPGHNGANARDRAAINRQVPAGRGRTKPCNTTGTSTDDGYPEHAFTFDVAHRVGDLLTARGIRVGYTRQDDNGIGPCVDARAAAGNEAAATAVVSIHADGSTAKSAHGFHIAYSDPPLNVAQGEPSSRLAVALRDGLLSAGFAVSSYIGQSGLSPRDDLAGLNLSERPAALVECGNMRNPAEAAAMSTPSGRQRYADAIAASVQHYLVG
ncbi:N-acetylmuramoyl-L-alanine amidase [Amycolatopsis nigrescens]|uniref:N-acetylmuramoyl-L-alanine amidase n=1 Tax=Amycolatopsis nigrescens TaxID=381445 RepID=UPI000A02CF57